MAGAGTSVSAARAVFSPPTHAERVAALGELSGVASSLRCLLEPDDDFGLIPLPGPGDWLTSHIEPGQTFDDFVAERPQRPDAARRVIYLLPIGDFSGTGAPPVETLRRYAAAFFQMETRVLTADALDVMQFEPRVNPQTHQLQILTTSILAYLKTRLPADAFCLLGVTWQDLYPHPSWNFVFGQASLRDRVGIYSFARYAPDFATGQSENADDDPALMLRRSCKVLSHETGHMFGLAHCIYYDCVLDGSNNLREADARTVHLCPVCLRKLQHSVGFDPVKRYRELAAFYRDQGWSEDAAWCEAQVAKAVAASAAAASNRTDNASAPVR